MPASLLKLAYQLRSHYIADLPLDRWIASLALGAAALLALLQVPRGFGRTPPFVWWAAGLLIALALLVGALRSLAARAGFVRFEAQPDVSPPLGLAASPADKTLIHATGLFEVDGRTHFFVDLLAYWRTFATREHTIMAIVHPSRFLGIAQTPAQDLGMWYIFFCPEKIESITAGYLTFGRTRRLALRVRYLRPMWQTSRRRLLGLLGKGKKDSPATVDLCMDTEETRRRVWADLLADEGIGNRE